MEYFSFSFQKFIFSLPCCQSKHAELEFNLPCNCYSALMLICGWTTTLTRCPRHGHISVCQTAERKETEKAKKKGPQEITRPTFHKSQVSKVVPPESSSQSQLEVMLQITTTTTTKNPLRKLPIPYQHWHSSREEVVKTWNINQIASIPFGGLFDKFVVYRAPVSSSSNDANSLCRCNSTQLTK